MTTPSVQCESCSSVSFSTDARGISELEKKYLRRQNIYEISYAEVSRLSAELHKLLRNDVHLSISHTFRDEGRIALPCMTMKSLFVEVMVTL